MTTRPKLLLVDASNHFHRAFGAGADLTAPDGFPTGGLHSFFQIMHSVEAKLEPTYIVLVFDKGRSFRREMYADYKAQRPEKSQSFRLQWEAVLPLCKAAGYTIYREDDGFEADDTIATLAEHYKAECDVEIFSADKDFAQLVDEHVSLVQPDTRTGQLKMVGLPEVLKKYGGAENVVTFLSLLGDASDNVPGVPGVGKGYALKYIQKYGGWENIVANAEDIGGKKGAAIAESQEIIERGVKLITVVRDQPLDLENSLALENLSKKPVNNEELYELSVRYGLKVIQRHYELTPPHTPSITNVSLIQTMEQFDTFRGKVSTETLVVYPCFSNDTKLSRKLLAIGVAIDEDNVAMIQFTGEIDDDANEPEMTGLALFDAYNESTPEKSADSGFQQAVWTWLFAGDFQIVTHDAKQLYAHAHLHNLNWDVAGLTDLMLLDYLDRRYINHRDHSLEDIAQRLALYELYSDVDADLNRWVVERCHTLCVVASKFELTSEMNTVLTDIEYPCIPVLAEMECTGIAVDVSQFSTFAEEISVQLTAIDTFVTTEMGRAVNLKSPKQVATMLYKDRGLTPSKKTKSGGSTDSTSLQVLMENSDDPLIPKVLEYREIHKIKSTYLETLPEFVQSDGRIHTHFQQTVTATGRLSSVEPNLQNIPVRKSWGKVIRSCFVAEKGKVLLSADYSQIEMRILAHFCGEGALLDAFVNNEDIHYKTAVEIAKEGQEYTPALRTIAKAINYGLIYGMSSYRLARELNISREDASEYMKVYFEKYPEVSAVLERLVESAKENGVAQTLDGRQRPIFSLDSRDRVQREAAERIAMNAPIQGTAADIMKRAMCAVHKELKDKYPTARLLLQVHDELVVEADPKDAQNIADMLQREMTGVVSLRVPLVVEVAQGSSWGEIH